MAYQEPKHWSMPLGKNADIREIPDNTPNNSGQLSFNDLFPMLTSVPIEAGGVAPDRLDMNAVLKLLGENIYFLQNGGIYAYSPTVDYEVGCIVFYENNIYKCVKANGVSTVLAQPDNKAYWALILDVTNIILNLDLAGIWRYSQTVDYIQGNIVYYQDNYYKCIKNNGVSSEPVLPTNPEYWTQWNATNDSSGSDLLMTPKFAEPTNNQTNVNTFTVFKFSDVVSFVPTLTIRGVDIVVTPRDGSFDSPTFRTVSTNINQYVSEVPLSAYTAYKAKIRTVTNYADMNSAWSDVLFFMTGAEASVLAPDISCNENPEGVDATPIFTLSDIRTSEGAPADTIKTINAWIETQAGKIIYTFPQGKNLTFAVPQGTITPDNYYVFKAQMVGNRFGAGAVGSLAFKTLANFPYIKQPSLLMPVAGSTVIIPAGVTLQGSAFEPVDMLDQHTSSNWFLGKGTTDNFEILLQDEQSPDLLSHVFSSDRLIEAGIKAGDSLIPQVSYNGNALGTSERSAPFVVTATNGFVTPSGRILYRDASNKGSVLEINYQGTKVGLLVPDTIYRQQGQNFASSNISATGAFIFGTRINNTLQINQNVLSSSNPTIYNDLDNGLPVYKSNGTNSVRAITYDTLGPITDEQLNNLLYPAYQNENKTAKELTDLLLEQNSDSFTAAKYARSLTSVYDGGLDLPLLHYLIAIFIEGNYLDSLDPTVSQAPNLSLSKLNKSYRWFNPTSATNPAYVVSCQYAGVDPENNTCLCAVNSYLSLSAMPVTQETTSLKNLYNVLPIKEL